MSEGSGAPPAREERTGQPETGDEEIGYAGALAELEGILDELEGEAVDIDRLAERVQRAATLISLCRGRIVAARAGIEAAVAELDRSPGHAAAPSSPPSNSP
jgi:exodeoxyribonuclease VII small subunit